MCGKCVYINVRVLCLCVLCVFDVGCRQKKKCVHQSLCYALEIYQY